MHKHRICLPATAKWDHSYQTAAQRAQGYKAQRNLPAMPKPRGAYSNKKLSRRSKR
jgi:hypothetical protein